MAALVFIDTDILIDVGRDVEEAVTCLQTIEQQGHMAVSAVTQMELMVGCRNKGELNAMEHFLDNFVKVSINENISQTAVDLLKRYRLSHGLLIADALIAATAISEDSSLVSKNQRDYRFIQSLRLLSYPNPLE